MEEGTRSGGRRVPKSLFVLLFGGLLAFGALVMLVRMPRPVESAAEDINDDHPRAEALTASRTKTNDKELLRDAVCKTDNCKRTAYTLLNSMNTSVDPCQDFYSYACGGWIAKNPILPSVSKWSPFGQLDMSTNNLLQEILREPSKPDDPQQLNQAKDFFKACSDTIQLDKVGLKPILSLLQMYGGWPILYEPGAWNASSFNWMRSLADLKRMFGTGAILDIVVNQHTSNPSYSTVHMQQPSLFLSRSYFLHKEQFPHYINAYKKLIVDIATELKSSPAITAFPNLARRPINRSHIMQKASEIVAFEEEIAKLTRDGVEVQYGLRNYTATLALNYLQSIFNNYTTQNVTNKLDIKQLLDYTFRSAEVTASAFNQLISMSDTNFMGNIFELLSTTPAETVANYLHFRMMGWVVSGTTSAMRDHIQKYQGVVYGIPQPSSRAFVCASSTEEKFGLALTQPYLRKVKMGNDVVKKAGEMFQQVRTSFVTLLDSAKWMNSSVKATLKKKARGISSCIGFAPWMSPNSSEFDSQTFKRHLNTHFEGLNIGNGGYLQKLWNVRTWMTDQKLKLLKQRFVPGCKWTTFPGQIGAFYDIRRQAVNVPLGLLQPPFFYDEIPTAVNYGGFFSILGHEFSHGFTVNGWTETNGGKFSPISQCFVDQYNRFKVPEIAKIGGLHINGALTLDENFPDNAGLTVAYKTFKTVVPSKPTTNNDQHTLLLPGLEKLSQEQLFFIGFANIWCSASRKEGLIDQVMQDNHTPNRYRVIGSLQNSPEFSEAWNCPSGSVMNPPKYKKCSAF